MGPIQVVVRRNGSVEARHEVHAVAVRRGEVVAAAGDPDLVCFMRSSSKPVQALPLARARGDLTDAELAIACASHRATDDQVAAARALLAKAPATEDDLEVGLQEGRPPQRIFHNCSGKHAGMLALARAHDWPLRDYRLPDHPVQRAARDAHCEAAEAEPDASATDGCGVVTFAYPLRRMAHAFARLAHLPAGESVSHAMRSRPDLVGGPDGADLHLMQRTSFFAKGGAEGLLCAGNDEGLGIALKSTDGSSRPLESALAAFLGPLGFDLADLAVTRVKNSRGELVGDIFTNL